MALTRPKAPPRALIIDCDIHESIAGVSDLVPYLAPEWQQWIGRDARPRVPPIHPYVLTQGGTRRDAMRPGGKHGGMDLQQVRWQHLDAYGITYGVLMGNWAFGGMPQTRFAAGLASAYNDWLIEHWLERDERLLGSVSVAPQVPHLAAREIDRVGSHPKMVQVGLSIAPSGVSWGDERYDPIWESAVRSRLRVAFHVQPPTALQGQPTAWGWPGSYMELRCVFATIFEIQLYSLVCNGVFERFPDLKVVLVEGGFAWVPGSMWRMDATWKAVHSEVPWLRRRPSEYVREHVRFTTQPMEEPPVPRFLNQMMNMLGSDQLLMFASDYPHWDFDDPRRALPPTLGDDLRQKLLWRNAADFYGLEEPAA